MSLVRSNDYLNIGFLDSKNRLVVALSRARRGLYIFGNAVTLITGETTEEGGIGRDPLWEPLTSYMRKQRQLDIDRGLPTVCQKHGKVTEIREAGDFVALAGGCDQKCYGVLSCGHRCQHNCHPCKCDEISCREACLNILGCGHGCSNYCGQTCACDACFVPEPAYIQEPVDVDQEYGSNSWVEPGLDSRCQRSESYSPRKNGTIFHSSDVRNYRGRNLSDNVSPRTNPPKNSSLPGRHFGKSRNNSAARPLFESPKTASPASSPGSANKWKTFNAKKADEEMEKRRLIEEAAFPKPDPAQMVYHETYLPTTTKSGIRVKGKGSRRILSRVGDDGPGHRACGSVALSDPFGDIGEAFSELEVISKAPSKKTVDSEDLIDL